MQLTQLHTLRSGLQVNASPAKGRALIAMESTLRDLLTGSDLFDTVEVEHTDDPDQLVVSLCCYRHHLSEEQVAVAIDHLWNERVRYPFWEAHSTNVDEDYVALQGVTRESAYGHYVTVHLIAQRSPVPAQRSPI